MTKRANLSAVFNECALRGIVVNIENSCCHTIRENKPKLNWIRAEASSMDKIMEEIDEEGSARVVWRCNPEITDTVINIFSDNNYTAAGKGDNYDKIVVIIDIDDLPTEFLKEWSEKIADNEEEVYCTDDDEDRVDPDTEVMFSKEEEEEDIIFHSEDESEEEDDDFDDAEEPIVDLSSEEEDEEEDD